MCKTAEHGIRSSMYEQIIPSVVFWCIIFSTTDHLFSVITVSLVTKTPQIEITNNINQEFLSNFRMSSPPCTNVNPLLKIFWGWFCTVHELSWSIFSCKRWPESWEKDLNSYFCVWSCTLHSSALRSAHVHQKCKILNHSYRHAHQRLSAP